VGKTARIFRKKYASSRNGSVLATSLAIRHAAAIPTIGPGQPRAQRRCRPAERVCPWACPSTLPPPPFAPSAAPMVPQSTTGVSGPRSPGSDAASRRSRDRSISHDSAKRQVCSSLHSAFCPRDCTAMGDHRVVCQPRPEWPTRAGTPFAGPHGSRGEPSTSPAASGGCRARSVLSHIVPDERSPRLADPANRTDLSPSSAGHSEPKALEPDFPDDESTGRSDDSTPSRRRLHRSLR